MELRDKLVVKREPSDELDGNVTLFVKVKPSAADTFRRIPGAVRMSFHRDIKIAQHLCCKTERVLGDKAHG